MGLPWISWPCIDWLDQLDLGGKRIFEYGGGGSTLYFLRRGASVRTVENSVAWAGRIQARVTEEGLHESRRFDLELVEIPEHPGPAHRELSSTYVRALGGGPWDLVLVDGADGSLNLRMECLQQARETVNSHGFVVLDDAWRKGYETAPSIMSGFRRQIFQGVGPSRPGVTRTDVYSR
jgi:predicted O-methyltransferase YrrM